jgi:hypothetical protein
MIPTEADPSEEKRMKETLATTVPPPALNGVTTTMGIPAGNGLHVPAGKFSL